MKKTEFLAQLRSRLNQLPPSDVEQTLEYYSEMIDDYIESGYSPDAAVAKMGNPNDVAAQILSGAQTPIYSTYVAKKRKQNGLMWLVVLGFPLWLPLLIVAFSVLLTLAIVIATLAMIVPWSLVVSFGASAIGLLIGTALILGALCIFSLWVALRLTALGARGIAAMFKGSCKLLFGRR